MIAKGLDFPNVTLVGVISADTSLNLPDFRASERTFQLISQVAGRSGRGTRPGEVVIQTLDPENYAISGAVEHDYVAFFEQEIEFRRELKYPPFSTLVNVLSKNESDSAAAATLDDAGCGDQEAADVNAEGHRADRPDAGGACAAEGSVSMASGAAVGG